MNTENPSSTAKPPHAPLILAVLTGQEISKDDFRHVAYAFVRTPRDSGPKILTKAALERARDIVGTEKVSEELRGTNGKIISAHTGAIAALVGLHQAALVTVLSSPIGAKTEDHPELKEARRSLGVLSERFVTRKALPGLQRKEEDRSLILAGLASDVFAWIKDKPAFADLQKAAEERFAASTQRIEEMQREFSARFPDRNVLQRVRMIGLIADHQTDPDSLSTAEKKVLVTKEGKAIFRDGLLTQDAKDRLNALQNEEGNPEWLAKHIRAIFARDTEARKAEAVKVDVGSGL